MKILIWDKNIILKNIGGPSGYLFNIHEYLKESPCSDITFYSDVFITKRLRNKESFKKQLIINIINHLGLTFLLIIRKSFFKKTDIDDDELKIIDSFDYIHVHSVFDMIEFKHIFCKYRGKIILTSHMPEPGIDELASKFIILHLLSKFSFFRDFFILKEIESYKNADYIMFPVPEALEVYTSKSDLFKKAFGKLKNKLFFVPTAIQDTSYLTNYSYLSQYNLSKKSLIVCYLGRHNKIKGYDILIKIAQQVLPMNDNIYFVIGGKEGPIAKMKNNRWIELGWANTADLLSEIDIFILPNRETYFDLILLEVLRAGKPILASRTGGNKFFEKFGNESVGISLFDINDIDSVCNKIIYYQSTSGKTQLSNLGFLNKLLFSKYFTIDKYIKTYINAVNDLL